MQLSLYSRRARCCGEYNRHTAPLRNQKSVTPSQQFGDYLATTKRRVAAKEHDRRLSATRLAVMVSGQSEEDLVLLEQQIAARISARRAAALLLMPEEAIIAAPYEPPPPPETFGDYLAVARRRVDAENYIQRAAAVMATAEPVAAVAIAELPAPLPAIPIDPVRERAQAIADSLGYRVAVRAVTFLGEQFEPIAGAEGARAARLTLEDGEVVMLGREFALAKLGASSADR